MSALAFPTIPLLRCPFCGNSARWFRTGRDVGVECTSADTGGCPGCAQTDVYAPEHAESAAGQWNRRPDSHESAISVRVLAALRDCVDDLEGLRDASDSAYARPDGTTILQARAAIAEATGAAA